MGFGINPSIVESHKARLWKFPVLYFIEDGLSAETSTALEKAMTDWGNNQNPGPLFQRATQAGAGVVTVKKTSGSNMWKSGDSLVGRNPTGPGGELYLKDDCGYDTLESDDIILTHTRR